MASKVKNWLRRRQHTPSIPWGGGGGACLTLTSCFIFIFFIIFYLFFILFALLYYICKQIYWYIKIINFICIVLNIYYMLINQNSFYYGIDFNSKPIKLLDIFGCEEEETYKAWAVKSIYIYGNKKYIAFYIKKDNKDFVINNMKMFKRDKNVEQKEIEYNEDLYLEPIYIRYRKYGKKIYININELLFEYNTIFRIINYFYKNKAKILFGIILTFIFNVINVLLNKLLLKIL